MNKENKAKGLMALAMFIFGTIPYFVRNIELSSAQLALYRAILASILLGSYLLTLKQSLSIHKIKKELFLLMFSGALMGINWILLFEAYKYTTVSIATLSYYFAPVIMMVVCPLLFKEKLEKKQIICFIVSSIGLILINGVDLGGSKDFLGIMFGLGAAVLYATVMLLNKKIKKVEGIHRTFIQFIAAIVILAPYVMYTSGFACSALSTTGIIYLLIVGLLHTGITYCMYFSALKDLSGSKVAILSYIDPLVAVLVSVLLLHESMTIMQICGGILILGFTLWSELPNKKEGK